MQNEQNDAYGQMGGEMPMSGGKAMHDEEWCVPVAALQMPGEDDQMNTPGVGDKVQFQAEGTVTRIEGENAYIKPEAANGKPLEAEEAPMKDSASPDEQEFASLKGEAEQQGVM
jgi:hypothetical protein